MEILQIKMGLLPCKSEWVSFLHQLLDVNPYQEFELDLVRPILACLRSVQVFLDEKKKGKGKANTNLLI